MPMIDATKWEEFYKKMTDGLKPYDHYDDGYRDAMDNVDDWMDGNQVEAEPVRHGRWEEMHYEGGILDGTNFDRCSVCGYERVFNDPALKTVFKYCPNCGAKMDGDSNE